MFFFSGTLYACINVDDCGLRMLAVTGAMAVI
jgi:hypothetical protein